MSSHLKPNAHRHSTTPLWSRLTATLASKTTMKYPSVYLDGKGAHGTMLSIAVAGEGVDQDNGARMIHNAPNTSSSIVSKSIAKDGGAVDYRGTVRFTKKADNAFCHVECDTIFDG